MSPPRDPRMPQDGFSSLTRADAVTATPQPSERLTTPRTANDGPTRSDSLTPEARAFLAYLFRKAVDRCAKN